VEAADGFRGDQHNFFRKGPHHEDDTNPDDNITNKGVGQDFYYSNLTTQNVKVYGPALVGIDFRAWVRLRIWVCTCTPAGSDGGQGY